MSGHAVSDEIMVTKSPVSHLLSGPPACDIIQGYPISTLPPGVERSTIYHFDLGTIYHNVWSPQWDLSTPISVVEINEGFFCVFCFFFYSADIIGGSGSRWLTHSLFQSTPSKILNVHLRIHSFPFLIFLLLARRNTSFPF